MKYLWFVGTMILMAWFVFRFVFDSTALFVGGGVAVVFVAIRQVRLDRARRE